jgi:hypothetical protein
MDAIKRDFEAIHGRLRQVEKKYNPQDKNLHFMTLETADAELFSALLSLANDGLDAVRRHNAHFSKHPLYDDGMFWYDLFAMVSSAALQVNADKTQSNIPKNTVNKLAEILVAISEFSTVHGGDIVKRNLEALGNILYVFYAKNLINIVRKKSCTIGSKKVKEFIEYTIKRVEELHGR